MSSPENKAGRGGICIGLFLGTVLTLISPGWGVFIGIIIFLVINPLMDF